jgi:hypothetical protein
MKNTYLLSVLLLLSLVANSQTTIFSRDFNGNNGGFNLLSGNGGGNDWVVNDSYAGGLFGLIANTPPQPTGIIGNPNSGYLHITNTNVCSNINICNANYDTGSISDAQITSLSSINTTGYSGVTLSFWYLSAGFAGDAYGTVEYAVGGIGPWTQIGGQLQGVSTWTQLTLSDPAFSNQAQLRFRFRWKNGNALGADPAFSVDDIFVKGLLAPATGPVYLYSTANAVGTNYATLKSAFDAVNAGTYTGNLFIEINGDTTETASAVLNASGGASSYTAISIKPVGGVRTISGNLALPMVDLNGADNVTIDGAIAGVKSLTISNTNTSITSNTSTIRLYKDATNNTITNSNILGSSTMDTNTNGGNILFGASSTTTGSDNNTISNCNIGPVGLNYPSQGIHLAGTSPTINNSGNTINNNNFIDIFANAVDSAGIFCENGSSDSSFTNNKFYQTTPKVFTAGKKHVGIYITNSSGENFTITGNTIGFANNSGTGIYDLSGSTGRFFGIFFNGKPAGILSNINNNTITSISLTGVTSFGTGSANPFSLLYIEKGVVSANNNTFGSQTTLNSIVFSTNTTSSTEVYGVFNNSTSQISSLLNNNFGGIKANNAATTGNFILATIKSFAGIGGTLNATSNTIGGSIQNSINNTSTSTGTVQNIGIWSIDNVLNATSNTVRNLTAQTGQIGQALVSSIIGISSSNATVSNNVSKNTIFGLSNSNNTNVTNGIVGIIVNGSPSNVVEKNLIYGMSLLSINPAATITGIYGTSGATAYSNNMIALGNGINNAIEIRGIFELVGNANYYHNSIYIGGSPTFGTGNSFAFKSSNPNPRNIRNNIFWNARSNNGATGKNYCLQVDGTAPNPVGLTINNNDYYITGTGGVFGLFNALDIVSITNWKIAVGQDTNSFNINPDYINPTNVVPDLHINTPACGSIGLIGANIGVLTDFDDQSRVVASPIIGADETTTTGTTTWDGTSWNNGIPNLSSLAIIAGNYDMTLGVTRPSISACSLDINIGTVTVSSGKYIKIQNDLTISTGARLDVLDKGSLVQISDSGSNTVSGIFTMARAVNQNITNTDYVYWSSPVANFSIANVSPTTAADKIWEWEPSVANTNAGLGNWINPSGNMTVGKGYIVRGPIASTTPLPFSATFIGGVPNNGIKTPTITRGSYNSGTYFGTNTRPITDADDNWNLVGNPYPSAIKTLDFLALNPNIEGAIRLWTHGTPISTANPNPFYNSYFSNYAVSDYITFNGTGTTSGPAGFNGFIASGQSFFVNMNDAAATPGTIIFKNSLRNSNYDNSQFYKTSSGRTTNQDSGRIWLNLISNATNEVSRILVGYVQGATQEKDRMFDAVNVYGGSQTFSSLINNDMMIIQGRALPFSTQDLIPLAVEVVTAGNYSIAISEVDGLFSNVSQPIFLEDKLLNITHDLRQAPYQFITAVGDFKNRFVLKYTNAALGASSFNSFSNAVIVSTKDKTISVFSNSEKINSIEVYDLLGRKLFDKNNINNLSFSSSDLGFATQGLIIKIKLENEQVVTKKIVF